MAYKRLLFIFSLLGCLSVATAQQLPLVAQHPEFHGLINPASLNIDYLLDRRNVSFGTSWRQQWLQLGELSPSTQVVRGEYIINPNDGNSFIVGGYAVRDRVGITNNLGLYGRAAYIIKTGQYLEDGGISVGLNVGLANWRLHTERLSLAQPDDPDLTIKPSSWYPDVGFGAYWYLNLGAPSHYLYLGVSSPRTFEFRSEDFGARRVPHYYGLVGYYLPIPLLSDNGYAEVSIWSRYVANVPLQSSFHFKIQPMENLWVGMGLVTDFKTYPMRSVEVGVNVPFESQTLKIGYSYSWGSLLNHFGATHEFNVAFALETK
jgi:type IX secretion system PorP/SprF family membrane protein